MESLDILPWHRNIWQQLYDARVAGRLPHGLLLSGPSGLGKRRFAERFAAHLLCSEATERPCGGCHGCALYASGNHPDFFKLEPDEDRTQIRVEQVRSLITKLSLSSHMRGYKVVIIDPAQSLNVNAQNSLLKTLEEPPANTVLMLVAAGTANLAATVLSRCQLLHFRCPEPAQAQAWLGTQDPERDDWQPLLALAGGAPVQALALANAGAAELADTLAGGLVALINGRIDPVTVAESWASDQLPLRLRWLQRQVYALIQWRSIGSAPDVVHRLLHESLQNRVSATSVKSIYDYLDALEYVISLSDRVVNQTLTVLPLLSVWEDGPNFERTVTEKL